MTRVIHVIPVPAGWSVEQAWEAIQRGDRLTDPEPMWANVETDGDDRFVRVLPMDDAKPIKFAYSTPWQMVPFNPPERCGAQPSKRSTARCEMPPGHEGWHTGRTRGGYWKGWPNAEKAS